jgi:signal transduction histidine kinase
MEVIQHMSQTIDDFRNFFQSHKEMVEFTIGDVVASTVSLIEDSLRSQQISIDVNTNSHSTITGFPNEYSHVLLNIIMNSKDALLTKHHDKGKVTITISKEQDRSVVTIADNGGGIPEEIIGKVFEPYFSTKGAKQGTGIGLFMSKTIIEKNMKGRLTVRNIGDGAEFRIEI